MKEVEECAFSFTFTSEILFDDDQLPNTITSGTNFSVVKTQWL